MRVCVCVCVCVIEASSAFAFSLLGVERVSEMIFTQASGFVLVGEESCCIFPIVSACAVTFRMENLQKMFETGLYINDLSMHDSSRDLVLAGTQQQAELKMALDQVR